MGSYCMYQVCKNPSCAGVERRQVQDSESERDADMERGSWERERVFGFKKHANSTNNLDASKGRGTIHSQLVCVCKSSSMY